MSSPPRINFVGCGRAGRALGRLWHEAGVFTIGDILTRSVGSAEAAVDIIGAGRAVSSMAEMGSADLVLVATPDDQICAVARKIVDTGLIGDQTILFHLSGALASMVLEVEVDQPGFVASCHPLRSFGNAVDAADQFSGTWCGLEGDAAALTTLTAALGAVGARTFTIQSDQKLLYHAASVMASNYLNALIETSAATFALAGVDRNTAFQIIKPMIAGTVANIFQHGPGASLTGPIARGDASIVDAELQALRDNDEVLAMVYQGLGAATARLAHTHGLLDAAGLDRIVTAIQSPDRES